MEKKILSIQYILRISFDMISVGSILLVQLEQELKKFNITYIPTIGTTKCNNTIQFMLEGN